MIYVLLADGFEEIEGLAVVDILRRAGLQVQTVGVTGKTVVGSHQMPILTDVSIEETADDCQVLVLPGGMPGTKNLEESDAVQNLLDRVSERNGLIAAICAAPSVLGHRHMLEGKTATCYPGFEKDLYGANVTANLVEHDGNIITGKGPGAAIPFALELVRTLVSEECAQKLFSAMQCR